jgi:hypothetical protein
MVASNQDSMIVSHLALAIFKGRAIFLFNVSMFTTNRDYSIADCRPARAVIAEFPAADAVRVSTDRRWRSACLAED